MIRVQDNKYKTNQDLIFFNFQVVDGTLDYDEFLMKACLIMA